MNSGVDNLNVVKNILQNSKELNREWKDFSVDKIIKMIDLAKKIENTESLSEKNQLRKQFYDVAEFYYKDLKQILKEEKRATKQLKKDEQWNRGKPNNRKRILLRRKEDKFSKIYNELCRAVKEKISPNEELSDELKAMLNILSKKLVNSGLSFEDVKENIIGDKSHGIICVLDQLDVYRDTFDHNNNEALLHVLTNINDYCSIGNQYQEKEIDNKTESLDRIKKDNRLPIAASVFASCVLFCGVTALVVRFHQLHNQLIQQMQLQALQRQAQNETRNTAVIVNQNYDNLNLNNNQDLRIVEGNNLNNNDDILNINNINNNNNINNMPNG